MKPKALDLFLASTLAVVFSVIGGVILSPLAFFEGWYFWSVTLLLVPIAIVFTGMAIPIALICVRRGTARLWQAILAGIIFGWAGAFLGTWGIACWFDFWILGECHDLPSIFSGAYGVSYGLLASVTFWSVLRQRDPGLFGAEAPMRSEQLSSILFFTWVAGVLFTWACEEFKVGVIISP
ncbi:hypothetical protein [Aestuariicoccus sp. MJ-SS9]|uniref:hypothetical protein n=1 Tax=Aestuariicoccus sp. MJ-SS9 TaxID=3079855 RepID=UPI0029112E32|nr:hypothetical protein [Aestuariicoccus sp. MJ-SS9]MDU8910058.1 hypothetical protein [Aestuariicoccus sp. MJ-SS9]